MFANATQQSQDRASTQPLSKPQVEIFNYLCENDGPDDDYRAHPKKSVVMYHDLKAALDEAQSLGFAKGLKPYHIPKTRGLWEEERLIDEIILKRVDTYLYGKYDGDFIKLCQGISAKDILKPLEESINGRDYRISVAQPIGAIYNSSPYQVAERYLVLTNQEKQYSALRPYHFSCTSQGTYNIKDAAREVIGKKIKTLLREKYNYDLPKLCLEVDREELLTPFVETINNSPAIVKVSVAAQVYNDKIYDMLMSYIDTEGRTKEFKNLKPYHLSTASQATYNSPLHIREVIIKSCKYLISSGYDGDEKAFLKNVTLPELTQPFYERVAGEKARVVTDTAIKIFGESSNKIKKLYRQYRNDISLLE